MNVKLFYTWKHSSIENYNVQLIPRIIRQLVCRVHGGVGYRSQGAERFWGRSEPKKKKNPYVEHMYTHLNITRKFSFEIFFSLRELLWMTRWNSFPQQYTCKSGQKLWQASRDDSECTWVGTQGPSSTVVNYLLVAFSLTFRAVLASFFPIPTLPPLRRDVDILTFFYFRIMRDTTSFPTERFAGWMGYLKEKNCSLHGSVAKMIPQFVEATELHWMKPCGKTWGRIRYHLLQFFFYRTASGQNWNVRGGNFKK